MEIYRRAGEPPARPRLGFIGAGRAGSALAVAAYQALFRVSGVYSPRWDQAEKLAWRVGADAMSLSEVAQSSDLLILAVPDENIEQAAEQLVATGVNFEDKGVVHLSARFGGEVLQALADRGAEVGGLHPLQALTGAASFPLLTGTWFRVTGEGKLREQLLNLVKSLKGKVMEIQPEQAALYHAAAVLAGNAPLGFLGEAIELLVAAGVPRGDAQMGLTGLLVGAAQNAQREGPKAALTGPVARGDETAIKAHLVALEAFPEARKLYVEGTKAMERLKSSRQASERENRG